MRRAGANCQQRQQDQPAAQGPRLKQRTPGASTHVHPAPRGRRDVLLQSSVLPLVLAGFLPQSLLGALDETPPKRGTCPTCLGVVDGTLGSCASLTACMSSYDDRPGHFIAPWQHEERSADAALDKLQAVAQQLGGVIEAREPSYLYASFPAGLLGGVDDLEFWLPPGDTTVELRAAARRGAVPDGGRLERRFETLRALCGFEVVPVLRNRKRLLGVIETPWDSFGPTPPTDVQDLLRSGLDDF